MKKYIEAITQLTQLIFMIVCAGVVFLMTFKILEPLSPIITFFLVLGLTLHTFKRTWLGVLSLVGIVIYILSWPVTGRYGLAIGLSIWTTGFLLWFWSVYRSFNLNSKTV